MADLAQISMAGRSIVSLKNKPQPIRPYATRLLHLFSSRNTNCEQRHNMFFSNKMLCWCDCLYLLHSYILYAQNLICSIWYKQHRLFVGQYFHSPIAIPRVFVDVFWQLPRESRTVSSARHTPIATFLIIYILGWLYALVWLSLGCFAAAKMSSYIYIYTEMLSPHVSGGVKIPGLFEDWITVPIAIQR